MADIEGADIGGIGRNGRVPKRRVAVLISGGGSNLQALLDAATAPDYPAEIALVVSNVAGVHGLDRATKAQVPTVTLPHGFRRPRGLRGGNRGKSGQQRHRPDLPGRFHAHPDRRFRTRLGRPYA